MFFVPREEHNKKITKHFFLNFLGTAFDDPKFTEAFPVSVQRCVLLTATWCQTLNCVLHLLETFQQSQKVYFITLIFQMRAPSFRKFK